MEFLANENIVYTKDKDISYIQFKKLLEYPELIHAFTVDKRFNFKRHLIMKKIKIMILPLIIINYYVEILI